MEVKFTPIIQDGTILEKWNNSPHFFSSRARMYLVISKHWNKESIWFIHSWQKGGVQGCVPNH